MVFARGPGAPLLLLGLAACAGSAAPPPPATPPAATPSAADMHVATAGGDSSRLPPVPMVRGRLAIRVIYPAPDALVRARDSSFLIGSVGTGDATLTINGNPVRVWPNGAWLAWIPMPADSVMRFRFEARTKTDSASLDYAVRRGGWQPERGPALWLDSTSLTPRGEAWWPADEYLTITARASPGARLQLRLPDSTVVPLHAESRREDVPEGVRAFDRTPDLKTNFQLDRYVGVIRGAAWGGLHWPAVDPQGNLASTMFAAMGRWTAPDTSTLPILEVIGESHHSPRSDTVRARWPLRLSLLDTLPIVAELNDDSSEVATSDQLVVGRAVAGGTYNWFFPNGTRARVSGRINNDLRLRLSPEAEAWVDASNARPKPPAGAAPAVVGSIRLSPQPDRIRIRIPVSHRVPFQLSETDRTVSLRLYGALGDVNWIQYGAAEDPLLKRVAWSQDRREEVLLTIELSRTVWGYAAVWERGDLVLDIRRPPELDPGGSLKGRFIAVDPGHPPGGSTGPTGLREAEANLAIGLEVKRLLEEQGARVFMTRTEDVPIELWPRVDAAQRAGADLLVSIHNNALPDGVNPLTNSGSSVYYNHPRSVPLARAIQAELVRRLGVRDLGIGRGDLALVRTTWLPSVLTEGLFVIVPEQEAALRSPAGQRLYAQAVVDGIRRFLRERAEEP
jgi:N-acetylmuramoyl-L-alanine amidase